MDDEIHEDSSMAFTSVRVRRQTLLAFALIVTTLTGCRDKKDNVFVYDKPFRLDSSTCQTQLNPGLAPTATQNITNCRKRLSCVAGAVTVQDFDVIYLTKSNQFWRSVIIGNNHIPQLDIPLEMTDGWTYAGRYEYSGGTAQWQLAQTLGGGNGQNINFACLIDNNCANSESSMSFSGTGYDTTIQLTWLGLGGCRETYKVWTEVQGPLEQ